MLWPLPCMPCIQQILLDCKPCLEDLPSLETCSSKLLILQVGIPFLHIENSWSIMHWFALTKCVSTLTTGMVKKSSITAKLSQNLQYTLTSSKPILMAIHNLQFLDPKPWSSYLEFVFLPFQLWGEYVMPSCISYRIPGNPLRVLILHKKSNVSFHFFVNIWRVMYFLYFFVWVQLVVFFVICNFSNFLCGYNLQ